MEYLRTKEQYDKPVDGRAFDVASWAIFLSSQPEEMFESDERLITSNEAGQLHDYLDLTGKINGE